MLKRGVWKHKNKNTIPNNRRLIGSKWVFKINNNGIYRARLVALRYTQIPGIDYTENFAPVVNDVTLRAALVISIKNKWVRKTLDVETAFLEGILEEKIFMTLPPGYELFLNDLGGHFQEIADDLTNDIVCELFRTIYGLVQAALCWYNKIANTLVDNMSYIRSKTDPCLFYRKNKKCESVVLLYVDDSAVLGVRDAVQDTYEQLKNHYTVTIEDMKEYLGCT